MEDRRHLASPDREGGEPPLGANSQARMRETAGRERPPPATVIPDPTQAPATIEPTPTETSAEAGVRTGPTPIAPRTGAGNDGSGSGLNLFLVLATLAALSGGTTLALAGKRQRG